MMQKYLNSLLNNQKAGVKILESAEMTFLKLYFPNFTLINLHNHTRGSFLKQNILYSFHCCKRKHNPWTLPICNS